MKVMNRVTSSAEERLASVRRAAATLDALSAASGRALDRHARAWGLSDAKIGALEALAEMESGCCCLYDLGDCLGVSRPNVTKLIDGLEAEGLVERRKHASDGRMIEAHLTEKGRSVLAEVTPGRDCVLEDLWGGLSDAELADIARLLRTAQRSD